MGSRSATTSPTGSVHSTPTHQTKPNTLDPFADIGNLGGSLGGGQTMVISFLSFFSPLSSLLHSLHVIFFRRFWLLQQTHHPYWSNPFLPSHGISITASSISTAHRRVAAPHRTRLPLMATRCWKQWRMATPSTGSCACASAKAQSQPHIHASHIPPEPTQLQCQLLCNGRRLP